MKIIESFTEWRYLTPQGEGKNLILVIGEEPNETVKKLMPTHIQPVVIHFNKKPSATNQKRESIPLPDCSVGIAGVLFNATSLHSIPMTELYRVLNFGGGVCFFISKRGWPHLFRRFIEFYNLEFIQTYAVLPNFRNPYGIIPLGSKFLISSTEGMLRPIKPIKSLLWKFGMRLLNYIRACPLIFTDWLVIAKKKGATKEIRKEKGLRSYIKCFLGKDNLEFSLLLRPQTYYGKTTAQVMDSRGHIIAYAKIAKTPQSKHLLHNEAMTLKNLERLNLKTAKIPRLIYFGQYEQDTVLVQEAIYPFYPGKLNLSNQHIYFLAELFNRTAKVWEFEKSPLASSFNVDIQCFTEQDSGRWGELLQMTREKIRRRFAKQEIPLGLAHGDFAPWSTCISKEGRLIVYDWEKSYNNAAPLMDFYNFIVNAETLLRNRSGNKILTLLLDRRSHYFKLTNELLALYKFHVESIFDYIGFLMIYLYQTSVFYLNYRNLQMQTNLRIEKSAKQMLATLRTMLEKLLALT